MASTDQVRQWYPDVVVNHAKRGTAGFTPICDTSKAIRVPFPKEGGGTYSLLVHPKTKEAWEAYVTVMAAFGETVPSAGGTHNCRNIANTNSPSLHAYCVALDIPPNDRKSAEFQAAVLKIKTNSGVTVFKNLASINDRMHDQIDCSPEALASGINWTSVVGGIVADHSHKPMPNELPRDWADGAWELWVARSGTNDDTRTHTFYREDLSWVYGRVIQPLEKEASDQAKEIALLTTQVAQLKASIAAQATNLNGLTTRVKVAETKIAALETEAPPTATNIFGTVVRLEQP